MYTWGQVGDINQGHPDSSAAVELQISRQALWKMERLARCQRCLLAVAPEVTRG